MRTLCLVLVGVVVGWAASGVDWTRDAAGQDAPAFAPHSTDGVLTFDSLKPASVAAEGEQAGTGPREPFERSAEATATTTATEGVIPAPRQKGFADLMGAAQMSAGIGRYQLKVQSNNGYYVIDSLTGRVWYGTAGGRPELVAAELPQQ